MWLVCQVLAHHAPDLEECDAKGNDDSLKKNGIQDAAETSPDVIGGILEGLFIECGLSLLRAFCGYVGNERRYGFWCQGTIFGCGDKSHAWMIGNGAGDLRFAWEISC